MIEKIKNNNFLLAFTNFLFIFILMLIFIFFNKMAPFGNSTFAGMDANVQYVDLFNYYRNVLEGKDSFAFSLSNLLGGSSISIFGYYLASPLNLISLLFKPQNTGTVFFNLLFTIKVSFSAAFFSIFISYWFNDKNKRYFNIIFSSCYALMQYNVSQASNIIWLDGVYLLPLILLGVHRGVKSRKWLMLSVTIGCSLIFNWYTGIINCFFSFIWFIFEMIYLNRKSIALVINYFVAGVGGALLSGVVFYPVYKSMQGSSRNGFDWSILRLALNGNPLNFISNYVIGGISNQGSVSLYCGMLTLAFVIALFFSKQISTRTKLIFASLIFVVILLFYFVPLVFIFSIFKEVDSYWYRYSYVGCFVLLFVAQFYINNVKVNKSEKIPLVMSVCLIVAIDFIFGIINIKKPEVQIFNYFLSGLIALILTIILIVAYRLNSRRRVTLLLLLIMIVSCELLVNLKKEYTVYSYTTISAKNYADYVTSQNKMIRAIREKDFSLYRISQTKTRLAANDETLTANYNEGLGFNYPSISGYTSSPSEQQLSALDRFGYRTEQQRISVVNTSILPTDSLLGVKYILSPYKINGLEKMNLPRQNNKNIFINPYAFPLAFTGPSTDKVAFNGNTFDYQENVIDNLVGQKLKIYEPVKFTQKKINNSVIFTLAPTGKGPVYGNLPWNPKSAGPTTLYANNRKLTAYSQWLSPSVFYVPRKATQVKVTGSIYKSSPEFYQVNLDQLKKASDVAQRRSAKIIRKSTNQFEIRASGNKNSFLYLSIPDSGNWLIQNNGKLSKHKNVYGVFLQIPLHKGNNRLVLTYHNPGIITGIIMTLFGILVVVLQFFLKQTNNGSNLGEKINKKP
ncbi:YfhO family protein [Limosilactobacillus reuteri]|uniref:YfhO family protein n=1 Tax=Limosilactobacillus reuteri TaxID=1598 RepID=UPI001E5A0FF9|nr:YfhO family protein [Limosilactobacillus reuteri]MCC4328509.1 YfhO family protein [Limosilactobacillus reuteri]MCC4336636.1 YfhO family protein [Limosilactobacillus reuteri]MCC4338549.1 YfhO family protein [Limosilactobacillus reuteri]